MDYFLPDSIVPICADPPATLCVAMRAGSKKVSLEKKGVKHSMLRIVLIQNKFAKQKASILYLYKIEALFP